jgi:hypothetical protein
MIIPPVLRIRKQVLYREEYQQRPQRGQEGIDIVGAIAEIVGAREAVVEKYRHHGRI